MGNKFTLFSWAVILRGPPATFPQWSPFPSLSHKSPAAADWPTSADKPFDSPQLPSLTVAYCHYACTTNELLESVWDFKPWLSREQQAWASLAFRTVLNRETRILYNKSNSGCFRLNTRKCFFCNERLLFVNETMYSEETENCLYSYLLENKGELLSRKKTREVRCVKRVAPISRVHLFEMKTKTMFSRNTL